MATLPELRTRFNDEPAADIAHQLGFTERAEGPSKRFAYFADHKRYLVVAGPQEGKEIELALAYGTEARAGRDLLVAVPQDRSHAFLQRVAWLRSDASPEILLHDLVGIDGDAGTGPALTLGDRRARIGVRSAPRRSPAETIRPPRAPWSVDEETQAINLAEDWTAVHLGARSSGVADLVEWATGHPHLSPGHRQPYRSWHCLGRQVLKLVRTTAGVTVIGGVDSAAHPHVTVDVTDRLSPAQLDDIRAAVEHAADVRLGESGAASIARDEGWLQGVLRARPEIVGIEQPALREVPAWRPPHQDRAAWGRGYIDLLGLDGHGDIRIAETKLDTNQELKDGRMVLQGLDYYVWARANERVLRRRLAAHKNARFVLHFVVGVSGNDRPPITPRARALLDTVDPSIPWHIQYVQGWQRHPEDASEVTSTLYGLHEVP